jgi:hypothetical protein
MASVYNTMYRVNIGLWIQGEYHAIQSSDLISIAFVHRYDTATYPIVRFRFYADASLIETINEDPNNIMIVCNMDGGIYKSTDENDNTIVRSVPSIRFSTKAYIENKNIPISKMDQYKMGERDTNDLNVDSKNAFELFAYDDVIIHKMRQRAHSIYRNTTIETVMRDLIKRVGITENKLNIDPIYNQTRYDQILIPNLTTIEAFTFFDRYYGIYRRGGILYYDFTQEKMFLSDSSSYNNSVTIPIYVRTEKFNSEESGIFLSAGNYHMQTGAVNVSVLSESDIEQVLNPEILSDVNVNTFDVNQTPLTKLFNTTDVNTLSNRIEQKNRLHKSDKQTISVQEAARINERITHVDLSGAGFHIDQFDPTARFNLVFESPIRGLNIADSYRAKYVCHVLTNSSGDLFAVQTTMELCTN